MGLYAIVTFLLVKKPGNIQTSSLQLKQEFKVVICWDQSPQQSPKQGKRRLVFGTDLLLFLSMENGGGWTRTSGDVSREIYSLLQLPLCDTP